MSKRPRTSESITVPAGFTTRTENGCTEIRRGALHGNYQLVGAGDRALGNPSSLVSPYGPEADQPKFLQNLSLAAAYAPRVVPVLARVITAAMINSTSGYLSRVVAPIWETTEKNFVVNAQEYNETPFQELAEGGIPYEGSHFNYNWKSTSSKWKKAARLGLNLAMDPIFGPEAWQNELANLASCGLLTLHQNIIYGAIDIGYSNLVQNRKTNTPVDVNKLYQMEDISFHIMALDPVMGWGIIRKMETDIPRLDTVIVPKGKGEYFRDLSSESLSMFAQRITTDPASDRLMVQLTEGPNAFRTIDLGNRAVNVIEQDAFVVNSKDKRSEQPLTALVTLAHYFGMDPNTNAEMPVNSTTAESLTWEVFHQTPLIGEMRTITIQDRLKYCNYWNRKTGKVEDAVGRYAQELEQRYRTRPECIPWSWNENNKEYDGSADVNKENTEFDNNTPNMREVAGKSHPDQMKSFRQEFAGTTYVPESGEVKVPILNGDWSQRGMPNAWVHKGARTLCAATPSLGRDITLDGAMEGMEQLMNKIKAQIPVREYFEDLIRDNKALESTPKRKNYPGAHTLQELKPNSHGSLKLPADNRGMIYPSGFHFIQGIRTIADNDGLWTVAAKEAKEALAPFEIILKHLQKSARGSELIDGGWTPPWIHKEDALNTLLDSLFTFSPPLFLGVDLTRPQTLKNVEGDDQHKAWEKLDEEQKKTPSSQTI